MDRRTFLRQTASLSAVVSAALAGTAKAATKAALPPADSPKPGRPNVIMFLTDDNAFEFWGFSGGPDLSPKIDKIAKEGVTCTRFYCASSVCTPSRYNLQTGKYAGRCRAKSFLTEYPTSRPYCIRWNTFLDAAKDFTIGNAFRSAGYRTGFVGKWHLTADKNAVQFNPDDNPADPQVARKLKIRYDSAVDVVRALGYDYVASLSPNNNDTHPLKALRVHNLEWLAKGAIDFLDACKAENKPFFLIVNLTTHHGPCHRESIESDIRLTQAGLVDGLEGIMPPRKSIRRRVEAKGYKYDFRTAGTVWTDDCVGAVLNRLRRFGLQDNTAVLFTTDHNTAGSKATCYQQGTKIPFAMRLKNRIPAGVTCERSFQMFDIMPTLMEMCSIELPKNARLDGASVWNVLSGKPGTKKLRDELYFEFGYVRAILRNRFKYIAFRLPADLLSKMKTGKVKHAYGYQGLLGNDRAILKHGNYFAPDQLYNLENDPDELMNLACDPKYAGKLAEMKKHLKKYLAAFDHPFDIDAVDDFYYSHSYKMLAEKAKVSVDFSKDYWWTNNCYW